MKYFILAPVLALIPFGLCDINVNTTPVIGDIVSLDNSVKTLIASTEAYNGGVLLSQGIDFAAVEAKLTKANADIGSLPHEDFDLASIEELEKTVSQTLAIDNPDAVNTLISKKSLIEATPGQGSIVEAGLESLLAGHLYFTQQALDRTPESQQANVQEIADVITDALQKGISAFSS